MAQTAEKRCILALYDFWESKGVHVGALVHDGLHVDKEAATYPAVGPATCPVRCKTGRTGMPSPKSRAQGMPKRRGSQVCPSTCLTHRS
eukprot:COSAG02_NODE_4201_length_5632_cov_5.111874_4_plen_89_part_00